MKKLSLILLALFTISFGVKQGDAQAAGRPAAAKERPGIETFLPSTTLACLSLKCPGQQPAFLESALHKIAQEPEMKAFLSHVGIEARRLLIEHAKQVPLHTILDLLRGELAVAFTGMTDGEHGPLPGIMVSVASPKGAEDAVRLLHSVMHVAFGGRMPPVEPAAEHRGLAVKSFAVPLGQAYYACTGDRLILTLGRPALEASLDLAGAPERSLASHPAFKKAAEKTGWAEAMAGLYVNTQAALGQFGAMIPSQAQPVVQACGIQNLKALAATSRFADGGIRDTVYLHAPGSRGGVVPPAGRSLDLAVLKCVPGNASLLSMVRVDPGAQAAHLLKLLRNTDADAYQRATEAIAQAEEMVGFRIQEDLLASLGTQFVFSHSRFESVLMVEVRDQAKFEQCLTKLASLGGDRAGMLEGGPTVWRELDYAGQTIRHLDIGAAPVPVSPSYAFYSGYAVLGLYPQTLKSFLSRMKNGDGALTDNEGFTQVCGKFLKGCDAVSYMAADSQLVGFYNLLVAAAHALHGVKEVELRAELMPHPSLLAPHLFDCANGCVNDADGVLFEHFSPVGSLGSLLGVVGALGDMTQMSAGGTVAVGAVAAGIMMPALARARGEARKAVCKSNVKQLGLGIMMYTMDYDENLPQKLEDLYDDYISADNIFVCPTDTSPMEIGKGLKCSYHYVGRLSKLTDPSVIILYDKRGSHDGGRNVLFYDGHVEWVAEWQLKDRLQESFELVRKAGWENLPAERKKAIERFYTDAAGG